MLEQVVTTSITCAIGSVSSNSSALSFNTSSIAAWIPSAPSPSSITQDEGTSNNGSTALPALHSNSSEPSLLSTKEVLRILDDRGSDDCNASRPSRHPFSSSTLFYPQTVSYDGQEIFTYNDGFGEEIDPDRFTKRHKDGLVGGRMTDNAVDNGRQRIRIIKQVVKAVDERLWVASFSRSESWNGPEGLEDIINLRLGHNNNDNSWDAEEERSLVLLDRDFPAVGGGIKWEWEWWEVLIPVVIMEENEIWSCITLIKTRKEDKDDMRMDGGEEVEENKFDWWTWSVQRHFQWQSGT
ncbi:hypothetical protein K435DRAFT_794138 [Dendrothele bispora CBS 962.96]|uniref:Uncharacterized protein n=1 Tax=Dendrothele bispora (strain CBS 962.96) TaxID=1314807 RepID=A0A4S8MD67_DENBC|nr:hypothetical protein K435DRAFT_794138 [Dendrothele bispora CBS 962.96]